MFISNFKIATLLRDLSVTYLGGKIAWFLDLKEFFTSARPSSSEELKSDSFLFSFSWNKQKAY